MGELYNKHHILHIITLYDTIECALYAGIIFLKFWPDESVEKWRCFQKANNSQGGILVLYYLMKKVSLMSLKTWLLNYWPWKNISIFQHFPRAKIK